MQADAHCAGCGQWLIASLTGPACAVVYAGGVVLLFREGWEPLAVGALGALCLIMLILWEGAAVNLDRERKPLSDWLP